jgi:phosphoribosylaminoimidazolecarboxamide formyltransferase/IMP cyclohydrolase
MKKRALISVSDKKGIAEFGKSLAEAGYEIISSGGTYKHLRDAGVPAIKVSDVTGFNEILGGRVKTLHPKIHGALLARYDLPEHVEELRANDIDPIQVVIVNLYPFAETIAEEGTTVQDAVEKIDIGGPTMVRASAKNFQHLTILTDPSDYQAFLGELSQKGTPSLGFRLNMARKAFQHTFDYDRHIADYLDGVSDDLVHNASKTEPPFLRISAERSQTLRYGENPHQKAGLYRLTSSRKPGFTQHQGKELSYNNLVDMEAAWNTACDFSSPTAVVVKHTNPCGIASHGELLEAFIRARAVDPVSSFGGVLAFNATVDFDLAKEINKNFAELVIAPSFTEKALKRFARKKNLRILEMKTQREHPVPWEIKCHREGFLIQERDVKRIPVTNWELKSRRKPTEDELSALQTAWTSVIHVKSNAIVYAGAEGLIGVGAGQMSRVDSAKLALWKAGEAGLPVAGAVMASDAFFPFRDSIDAAAQAGITAVVEPGGSIRDEEVIQAADEHSMALFFTGTRHFKH